MIRLVILAILFFAVIAISPLLINEKGYILIAMGSLTIESTVVTGVIMLSLIFLALLVLIKVLRSGFKWGSFSWNKIAFASRRKALKEFNQGISAYLLKDYPQAELLMAKCAESSGQSKLAWLVAASAANQQTENKNAASNSAHYLNLIATHQGKDKSANLETILITVKLFLQQQSYHQARAIIDDHHKLIGHDARLLSLEIELCIAEQRFQTAADYLVSARKQKTITENAISQWEQQIFSALFTEQINQFDQQHLHDYWQNLARKIKQSEVVLLAYCQVLASNKLTEPLNKLLLPKLKKDPSAAFLKQMRQLPITHGDELINTVQKHLQKQPDNGKWLSILAHLACASKQWNMADKAFHSLLNLAEQQYDNQDLLAYANSQQQQGLYQQANELLMKCYQQK
jgi:HemY protein